MPSRPFVTAAIACLILGLGGSGRLMAQDVFCPPVLCPPPGPPIILCPPRVPVTGYSSSAIAALQASLQAWLEEVVQNRPPTDVAVKLAVAQQRVNDLIDEAMRINAFSGSSGAYTQAATLALTIRQVNKWPTKDLIELYKLATIGNEVTTTSSPVYGGMQTQLTLPIFPEALATPVRCPQVWHPQPAAQSCRPGGLFRRR